METETRLRHTKFRMGLLSFSLLFSAALQRGALCALLLAGCVGGATAQQPDQAVQMPVPTLQLNSRLVVLDVVVLDKKGRPVTNLDRSQFTVTQNKVSQEIRDFEPPSVHQMPAGSEASPIVHGTGDLGKIGNAPVNILVLDELNTRWENTTYARMQMERYLKSQPAVLAAPTMLVATDEARFTVLHDYTQTRDELLASVHAYTPRYPMQLMRNGSGNTGIEMFEETLGALTQIAESSRGTPGRKNLLWVGTGYPSIDTTTLAFDDEDKLMALIRRVTDQMMASRVCLFLIDPAGVQTTVQDSGVADGDGGFTATLSSEVGPFEGKLDFASIASTTGGKIFANRNDVDTVIGEGIRDSNAYYTLTYVPPDAGVQDGKYRQIHVVLKDPSLRAVARSGYFAESVPVDPIPASGSGEKPANTLQFDMVAAARTRLVYNGLKVRAERVGDGFHLFIGVKDLRWETSTDSNLVTELSVMTVFFNEKGKEIQSTATEIKEKVGASVEVHGGAELEIKAPAEMPKGAARVRFVVRDAASGALGTADLDL